MASMFPTRCSTLRVLQSSGTDLAGRIVVAQADATNFSAAEVFGIPTFDRVFFSYALSMIPGWCDALDVGASQVAPGGSLHIVDFGQCERLPGSFKSALFAFLDHYTVTPRADLEQICRQICNRARAIAVVPAFAPRLHGLRSSDAVKSQHVTDIRGSPTAGCYSHGSTRIDCADLCICRDPASSRQHGREPRAPA